jgi:hypothetical protein
VEAAPVYELPAGTFTLRWIHEMLDLGGNAYSVVARDCADRQFDVLPAGTATVAPVLVDDVAACP